MSSCKEGVREMYEFYHIYKMAVNDNVTDNLSKYAPIE